jgi:hypothetical protein
LRGAGRALNGAAVSCCAALAAAGCAAGTPASQSSASPGPSVSAVTSAPPAAGNPRLLAREAYLGMWAAFVTASRTADYQYPSLDHYAAGAALELLTHGLYQDYREGIVTRGQPSFDPAVTMAKTSLGTAEAKVTDCADDTHATTYYKSGKPAPGDPPGRHEVNALLQPFDGTWKVNRLAGRGDHGHRQGPPQ